MPNRQPGPSLARIEALVRRIRGGQPVDDAELDAMYPAWVKRASEQHWTPYVVARRAAQLLVEHGATKILDVGSGAGKLCLIGALSTDAHFVGIEQRAGLVAVADQAARRCGASCRFVHGDASVHDWSGYDGLYLYNPFYEHVAEVGPVIEESITYSPELYTRYVTATAAKLALLPVGTRVVTYQGFGGPMPPGYRRLVRDPAGSPSEHLELWRKEAPISPAGAPPPR